MSSLSPSARDDGYVKFLTKGDNNQVDDRGLYSPGQLWLEKKDVIGRARGYAIAMPFFCVNGLCPIH